MKAELFDLRGAPFEQQFHFEALHFAERLIVLSGARRLLAPIVERARQPRRGAAQLVQKAKVGHAMQNHVVQFVENRMFAGAVPPVIGVGKIAFAPVQNRVPETCGGIIDDLHDARGRAPNRR